MAAIILAFVKLGQTETSFQIWKEMGNRLGIIPDVRAGSMTAAPVVRTTLEAPQTAIRLPKNRRRFKDRQVGGYGFDNGSRACDNVASGEDAFSIS